MFADLPDSALRSSLSDVELDAAITRWSAAIASAAAHRLLLIAEKTGRNYVDGPDSDEDSQASWNSAAAEVGLAAGVSHGRASGDMEVGLALATKLPKVAALLLEGRISESVARRIVFRTALITDAEVLAVIETEIADRATSWGTLSLAKLDTGIDHWINRFDPGAIRQTRVRMRDRGVEIVETKDGVTEIVAQVTGPNAALFWRRLTAMAQEVCKHDPRTLDQRRSDAYGALGAGYLHLACECGTPSCSAAAEDGRAANVLIHIYAEAATLDAEADPFMDGEGPVPGPPVPPPDNVTVVYPKRTPETVRTPDEAGDAAEEPDRCEPDETPAERDSPGTALLRPPPGVLVGFGAVPAPLIAALIAKGAKVRHLRPPGIEPEPGYRPSVALDEWCRARDLTCRFANCDRPAEFCDWDHTTPWPAGSTHASGGKLYCRLHHHGKTFWPGWSDTQNADGSITFTTPTGQNYTSRPGSSLYFPTVSTTSAHITTPAPMPNPPDKIGRIPKYRKRNRAKERAYRIKVERALNDDCVAKSYEPPPF